MKFGKHLNMKIYPEWRFYYMDYDELKRLLKERTSHQDKFNEYDEAVFVEALDREIEKVVDFKELKAGELERRIHHYEEAFTSMDFAKLEEKTIEHLRSEVEKVTMELSQLGKFCRVNYTGFLKILKKHDKHTQFMLRPTYMVRFNMNPIYLENMDAMIYRLSKLYNTLSNKGMPLTTLGNGERLPGGGGSTSQNFVRKTTKYWVHPDNVTDVKINILKNLPVLVYQGKKGDFDQAISSVYLDNEQMELYHGRLEKTEGAQAVRLRWYGSESPNEVFIERKIHREDWTGEISVKSRFLLKEKHVDAFLEGSYTMDKTIAKLRESGRKSESELEELATLSTEIQQTVKEKSLKPCLRTFYNRTAFQLPGDASVRISLDTDLAMIKEAGLVNGQHWRREDVECNFPFQELPSSEVVRFPYAILEVKLQTQMGQEPPKWVTDLVQGPLAEEVPKFSKFVHGCSVLFEKKVSLFPFWLPQMNIDIRKTNTPSTEQPPQSTSLTGVGAGAGAGSGLSLLIEEKPHQGGVSSSSASAARSISIQSARNTEHIIDIWDQSKASTAAASQKTTKGLSQSEAERVPLLLVNSTTSEKGGPSSAAATSQTPSQQQRARGNTLGSIKDWFRRYQRSKRGGPGSNGGGTARSTAPNHNKKIAIPIRVEPKVFFANERTFLSWLHFSIFLGGIATALVGLGHRTARLSGYIFAFVSVLFAFYALYLYQWRAYMIRQRNPGPYDDRLGPTLLVVVFLAAMIFNFVFSGLMDSGGGGGGGIAP